MQTPPMTMAPCLSGPRATFSKLQTRQGQWLAGCAALEAKGKRVCRAPQAKRLAHSGLVRLPVPEKNHMQYGWDANAAPGFKVWWAPGGRRWLMRVKF